MAERELLLEHIMQPATGKAFELLRGQVMRIEQIEDGGQCCDFNCFNLHDYKEHFHTGRTRHLHGLHPTTGDFLWSAPPRERPMAAIVADTVGTNDALYPRCSAWLFEYQYGLPVHTNCHDIQAEAQREFGLTPDDVHDSFNFFMHTGVDQTGHPYIAEIKANAGDYVEVLALFDLLAVPNVCGADVMATSNFQLKPLKVSIFRAPDEELAAIARRPEMQQLINQRTPKDFRIAEIKPDRELRRDLRYVPEFTNFPIVRTAVPVELSEHEQAMLDHLQAGGLYGRTPGETLRHAFHSWWIKRFMAGPKHYRAPA